MDRVPIIPIPREQRSGERQWTLLDHLDRSPWKTHLLQISPLLQSSSSRWSLFHLLLSVNSWALPPSHAAFDTVDHVILLDRMSNSFRTTVLLKLILYGSHQARREGGEEGRNEKNSGPQLRGPEL